MKKSLALTLLILLGAVFDLGIASGCAAFLVNSDTEAVMGIVLPFVIVFVMFVLHIMAFVLIRERFNRNYGLSSPKFVLCGAVPSVVIAFTGFPILETMIGLGVFGLLPEGQIFDFRGFNEFILLICVTFYTVCFAVFLSVVLAVGYILERR